MKIHGYNLIQVDQGQYQLEKNYQGAPVHIFTDENLVKHLEVDVFLQAINVARLPGLVGPVCIMPDTHSGYGAPIGTVFAMDKEEGYISPGAVGYDINCGMRLVLTNLFFDEIKSYIEKLVNLFFQYVPPGTGRSGFLKVNKQELKRLVEEGVPYLIKKGIGWEKDIEKIEEKGKILGADFNCISPEAVKRGIDQLATLGSGNHYLEVQRVEEIFDKGIAKQWGILAKNQITVMIHSGSRGFGHQVCTDYLKIFAKDLDRLNFQVIDRQLISLPINSPSAKQYFAAMSAAANYAFVNREAITYQARKVFEKVFARKAEDLGMNLVYDVAHNIAKFEKHTIPTVNKPDDNYNKIYQLLIHRKGATRSFPHQPVIIGGSMETGSYLLIGTGEAMKKSYGSTAHGSGRVMSRAQAKKIVRIGELWQKMKDKGIYVKSASLMGLAEEAGLAYKNISDVVKSIEIANLSQPVAYFKPIGNIKG